MISCCCKMIGTFYFFIDANSLLLVQSHGALSKLIVPPLFCLHPPPPPPFLFHSFLPAPFVTFFSSLLLLPPSRVHYFSFLGRVARRPPVSTVDGGVLSRLLTPTQASLARSKSAAALSAEGKDAPGNLSVGEPDRGDGRM